MSDSEYPITGNARRWHRRVLIALSIAFTLATAALIGFQHASELIAEGKKTTIFTDDYWQTVSLQSGIALATTALATALITLAIGAYDERATQSERLRREVSEREGVVATFSSDSDAAFLSFLRTRLSKASDEVIAIGLGLGFLAHNTPLLDLIANRMNKKRKLSVTLFHGAETSPGVLARLGEEEEWNVFHDLEYDRRWITRYPNTIRDRIRKGLSDPTTNRLRVESATFTPMISLIAIDDTVLLSWYGTPAMRGSETPWLAVQRNSATSQVATFAAEVLRTLDED